MKMEAIVAEAGETAIPKTLHFIWVGDDSKRPDNCIETWVRLNPGWTVKVWGNAELRGREWVNAAHIMEMYDRELNGVADMMRWEILYEEGGVLMDADSVCLRPLDDDLLDCEAFACWESEIARPGLIAAGYFGCKAGNPFVGQIILDIQNELTVVNDMAWKTVGPQRLTESYRKYAYHPLRIYPSHYFIPEHFSGLTYEGNGKVYAHQLWGSTRRAYDDIHQVKFDPLPAEAAAPPAPPAQPVPAAATLLTMAAAAPAPAPSPSFVQLASPDMRSALEDAHDPYFVQRVPVSNEILSLGRMDVFGKFCAGKQVLHVGCADWPITDPATSLHVALEPHCARLDGFDIHAEALDALRPYVRGGLHSRLEELDGAYDLVLAPEVMEHVPSVEQFLAQLDAIDAPCYLISVPDAYQTRERHFDYMRGNQTFVEVVLPDHNCWYSPYTFANTVAKYTRWRLEKMWFFNNISLLGLFIKQ